MKPNLPIEWEDKENNAELLAFLMQYGSKEYLSAEEINQLRDGVNELFYNVKKTNEQLPVQATLVPSSLVRVSNGGVSQSLTIQKIIDATSSAPIPYLSLKIEAKGHQNGVANFSSSLERGDYVTGVKEGDIVWLWARYNGGDPNNRENYSPGFENELPPLL